jgi:hypothetical protein
METILKRRFLIRILEKTDESFVREDELKEGFRITNQFFNLFLDELEMNGTINRQGEIIKLDLSQRLDIANKALELGADFEKVSYSLGWLEFEEMTANIFNKNGFRVAKRFRFNANSRRWEIDVLAFRAPLIICAECKHWKRGIGNSSANRIIEEHIEKVNVFTENLIDLSGRMKILRWDQAIIFPIVVTLLPTKFKIYRRVPVVSVLALPSFVDEFEGHRDRLIHHKRDLPRWKVKPEQTTLRI